MDGRHFYKNFVRRIVLSTINQLVDYYKSLPFDWLSYLLCIGNRPLVAKEIDLQIDNNLMAENSCFVEVSVCFFKIVFCPTSWFNKPTS